MTLRTDRLLLRRTQPSRIHDRGVANGCGVADGRVLARR